MAKPILDDALWGLIAPLLPPPKARRAKNPGRKPLDDRAVLTSILFVLQSGIPWEMLPQEMSCGSGMSCLAPAARVAGCRRLATPARSFVGQAAFGRCHRLVTLHRRFILNSSGGGRSKTGPNPTDRARPGSKHHLITEAQGIPLAVILTGANRNDVTQLLPLVEAIPPIRGKRGKRGRPLSKLRLIQADRGYDHDKYRKPLHASGIPTQIARRGAPHGSGLGKTRWVVERTHAWLHNFRRLRVRFERLASIHEAFLSIACSIICWRHLRKLHTAFC